MTVCGAINLWLDPGGPVEVFPGYQLELPQALPQELGSTPIYLDLVDAAGKVLLTHRCHAETSEGHTPGSRLFLHEVVPWNNATDRLVVRHPVWNLEPVQVEAEPPQISRLKLTPDRKGRILRVEWSAKHPQRKVTCLVRYSHTNGATWQALAVGVTESRYELDLDTLPGGRKCLVHVVASSGLRSAASISAPFSVPLKKPRVEIFAPRNGAEFDCGYAIVLRGGAYTPEAGLCANECIRWTSDRAGKIGKGFEVSIRDLPAGRHVIRMEVVEKEKLKGTAEIKIVVRTRESADTGGYPGCCG